jgi:competence protein ComEA
MEEKEIQLSQKEIEGNFFNFQEIWEKNKIVVIFGLIGLILVGVGVLTRLLIHQKEPEIQIVSSEEQKTQEKIFVHLEGAVEKPGVYELAPESRLNDLLILAGGLSAQADREWAEKNLNLAQKLADGAKIYIPKVGEMADYSLRPLGEKGKVAGANVGGKINLNTASVSQLDSLWGIGEKRAADIVNNRPYQTTEELITKAKIPKNVYEKIKDEISVY